MTVSLNKVPELSAYDKAMRVAQLSAAKAMIALLEANDELEIPYNLTRVEIWASDKEDFAKWARALKNAAPHKLIEKSATDYYSVLEVKYDEPKYYDDQETTYTASRIIVQTSRENVCEKKVVGTEKKTVSKLVTPAVYEDVEEDVEIVEWDCGSVLN